MCYYIQSQLRINTLENGIDFFVVVVKQNMLEATHNNSQGTENTMLHKMRRSIAM
jgi:hypothetical protein